MHDLKSRLGWVLAVCASSLVAGCGSSSAKPPPTDGGGNDATVDAGMDSSPPPEDAPGEGASNTCTAGCPKGETCCENVNTVDSGKFGTCYNLMTDPNYCK
jgi:hypothetical protein